MHAYVYCMPLFCYCNLLCASVSPCTYGPGQTEVRHEFYGPQYWCDNSLSNYHCVLPLLAALQLCDTDLRCGGYMTSPNLDNNYEVSAVQLYANDSSSTAFLFYTSYPKTCAGKLCALLTLISLCGSRSSPDSVFFERQRSGCCYVIVVRKRACCNVKRQRRSSLIVVGLSTGLVDRQHRDLHTMRGRCTPAMRKLLLGNRLSDCVCCIRVLLSGLHDCNSHTDLWQRFLLPRIPRSLPSFLFVARCMRQRTWLCVRWFRLRASW